MSSKSPSLKKVNKRMRYSLLLVGCLLLTHVSRADTTWVASGNVGGLWTSAGSPYMIEGEIHVPADTILSIGPGVTVFFVSRCYLVVESGARLEAVGEPGDSIYFTTDTLSVPEGWESIPLMWATDTCRFEYCVFEYAWEPGFGGVFWSVNCPLILHGCTFRHNGSTGWAGVGALNYTWVHISDCLFESNSSLQGGVFTVEETAGVIENCVFRNNTTMNGWSGGGAIYFSFQNQPLLFRNCEFIGNNGDYGGAIHSAAGGPTILFDSCTFIDNHAVFGGAIADVHNITGAQFHACRFDSNRADSLGGAIYMFSNTVDHCVITHNSAVDGGGIYIPESLCFPPVVRQCDIVGNTATNDGGGIYLGGPAVVLANAIAFSSDGEGFRIPPVSGEVADNIGYNLIFGNADGEFSQNERGFGDIVTTNINEDSCDTFINIFVDPQFADTSLDDYHLLSTSPCVDAGDPQLSFDPDTTIADIGTFYFGHATEARRAGAVVQGFDLHQNYPNPFNASTEVHFDLPKETRVELKVFNTLGQLVATLVNTNMPAGLHRATWNAADVPSGMYVYQITADGFTNAKKMLVIK